MSYDHRAIEAMCLELWQRTGIYAFDPEGRGDIFAVDTPPPYVSAAHLHVGHAMSYTQAEFVVRWHRMQGRRVFYPMGFDDNGLPTERFVERAHGIDASTMGRSAFRRLCREETERGAAAYEELWRSLGISVDWSLRYSTIDEHCQRTAQRSFLELYEAGRIYRSDDPVMWDPQLRTAVAQADLETLTRRQKLHTLAFTDSDGRALPISTTRPELLSGCVALYRHPEDSRYRGLDSARVPLDERSVPVLTDDAVEPGFGSGLVMVCTFGDAEDVRRWRQDHLETRICVGPDGRMTDLAGPLAGRSTSEARAGVVRALERIGAYEGFTMTEQSVPIAERSGAPIEWVMAPQWFLRVLDRVDALREMSTQLRWHPPHMKSRLDDWIDGLRWDWNLSRQRRYGVPIPMWLCEDCTTPVPAPLEALPVDPLETPPPLSSCPGCGGALRGDPDVMDTWMTSSSTPDVCANWVGTAGRAAGPTPMTVRVQAFEIIRSWLFYTLVKADAHHGRLPWRDVMISGWGLNEQGRKISKRDLEKSSDPSGFNRYDPAHVIEHLGADALRHWAGRSQLGHDLRYHTRDVKAGRKVAVKLWNAARLVSMSLDGFDPAAGRPHVPDRLPEDRDLLYTLDQTTRTVSEGLSAYDYATGLAALDRAFFDRFCDDWLEALKPRLQDPWFTEQNRTSAQATAFEALRHIVGLYAPFLPFVTEAIWQDLYAAHESAPSVHVTRFPTCEGRTAVPDMDQVRELLRAVRTARTHARIPQSRRLDVVRVRAAPRWVARLQPTLRAALRTRSLEVLAPDASDRVQIGADCDEGTQ